MGDDVALAEYSLAGHVAANKGLHGNGGGMEFGVRQGQRRNMGRFVSCDR